MLNVDIDTDAFLFLPKMQGCGSDSLEIVYLNPIWVKYWLSILNYFEIILHYLQKTMLRANIDSSIVQGDQRENICKLLVQCGLVKQDQLKVHGF